MEARLRLEVIPSGWKIGCAWNFVNASHWKRSLHDGIEPKD